jgi:NADPH2:quinone reductase
MTPDSSPSRRAARDVAGPERYGAAMRVVQCNAFGPLALLQLVDVPSPDLQPGQVRVAVAAAGVNFVDGLMVQGKYQIKPALPFVPGSESVGYITEVAPDVTTRRVGQRVASTTWMGGFADEVVAAAAQTLALPEQITDGQAATFLQSYSTAWFALQHRAGVVAGRTMLVLGAGGGVGLAAVDVGVALGLRVIAAASTADKRQLALDRGAEAVIDTSNEDVKERAKQLGGGSVDYVYDPVGGELAASCLRALGDDGQYLVVGFAAGPIPQLPANQILLRNRRVTGVEWGGWMMRHPAEAAEMTTAILDAIAAGRLHPAEPATFPLARAADALEALLERRVAGKVALIP